MKVLIGVRLKKRMIFDLVKLVANVHTVPTVIPPLD